MEGPVIKTAIPSRRYKLGEFTVIILSEIESDDPVDYKFILAVVRDGESQPGLYLSAVFVKERKKDGASCEMHLMMQDGTEVVGSSDSWNTISAFEEDALPIVKKILNLQDEELRQL